MSAAINKHALAGFLDCVSFDYFCTFTTRLPVSLASTRKIAERVGKYIDAHPAGRASYFWCAEKFDVREGYHFHALIKSDSIDKYAVWDWYFRRYGRAQMIDNREPDRQLAASYYVSKYVTKAVVDYDVVICHQHRGDRGRQMPLRL